MSSVSPAHPSPTDAPAGVDGGVSARPVAARLSAAMARGGPRGRDHARGIRDPGLAGLCGARRLAAAGRPLRLSARRPGVRAVRLVATSRRGADVGDLVDGRRHGRPDGRRRCAALRPDRQPRGVGRGVAERSGMAAAPQHAHQLHQRDQSARVQGGCGPEHRVHPIGRLLRRAGRRRPLLRPYVHRGHTTRAPEPRDDRRRRRRPRALAARRDPPARSAGGPHGGRIVDRGRIADAARAGRSGAWSAAYRAACPPSACRASGCATSTA